MTRFRHDLILRMIKLLDAVLVTIPFAMCWYLYYAKRVASPYYAKGDYLVVALFFVLFIIFGRVYDAFLMSMQRISEIIYEQFLAAAISDFIMYIVIWLLSKHLPNILPGVAALVGQVIMASIWAYNAHHAYFKTFPPQATAVIYDTRRGMERLIGKYGLDAKYKVVSTATAGECIENLSMLDGISTVFLSGIHSHDRNIILKYCVENNITVFVVPRIGDTIMSGAHHMHMENITEYSKMLYDINRDFYIVSKDSHGPHDLFVTYAKKEIEKLNSILSKAANQKEFSISSDYIVNANGVFDAFSQVTGKKVLKMTFPIWKEDNAIFTSQADIHFFEVLKLKMDSKEVDGVEVILIYDDKKLLDRSDVKKLLNFFSAEEGYT